MVGEAEYEGRIVTLAFAEGLRAAEDQAQLLWDLVGKFADKWAVLRRDDISWKKWHHPLKREQKEDEDEGDEGDDNGDD